MNINNKLFYYLALVLIVSLSFSYYSSNFYPLLNSDDALNILMAHYYSLPHDFYCWGQDRGGTIIPLISQIFIKIFKLSALTSVSLSNYLILILGFIGFSSLLKTNYSKLLLAIIIFLPYLKFIDILRFPIAVGYSLIVFSIYIINKLDKNVSKISLKNHLLLTLLALIYIAAIWASDLAIVTIAILLFILLIYNYKERRKFIFNKIYGYYFIFGSIACFTFIKVAKSYSTVKVGNYLFINKLSDILKAFNIVKDNLIEILTFQTTEFFVIIYTYCVLLLVIVLLIMLYKQKRIKDLLANKWFSFFFLDLVGVFFVFLISTWVLANGMGRWYFVATYISFSMVILIAVECLQKNKIQKMIKWFLVLTVVIGSVSTFYSLKYVCPKTLRPKAEECSELLPLGKIGIIGDFWNSYILSCPNPDLIIATQNDLSPVRNPVIVNYVFKCDNIFIIKDSGIISYPDTMIQFGHKLVKDGNEFLLAGRTMCKYRNIK